MWYVWLVWVNWTAGSEGSVLLGFGPALNFCRPNILRRELQNLARETFRAKFDALDHGGSDG